MDMGNRVEAHSALGGLGLCEPGRMEENPCLQCALQCGAASWRLRLQPPWVLIPGATRLPAVARISA